MFLRILQLIFVLAWLAIPSLGFAQSDFIRFDHLSIRDGLSQSSVNCILQDRKGFMWFGTQDGLNRFDGYNFTVFYNDPLDSLSLSENFIHAIIEDEQGFIWCGTDNGISRFDPYTQTFKNFRKGKASGLCDVSIWTLYVDAEGNLFAGTSNGMLAAYNPAEDRFTCYAVAPGTIIQCMTEDRKGNLWLGTAGQGVVIVSKDGKKTEQINERSGLPSNLIWCFERDVPGTIWIGTNNGVAHITNPDSYKDPAIEILSHTPGSYNSLSANVIKAIKEDANGNIWIGTDGGGLDKIITASSRRVARIVNYRNHIQIPTSLSNDLVYSIFEDKSGLLWVGTNNGVSKFDSFKQHFQHVKRVSSTRNTLADNTVWSVSEDGENGLWLGTRDGLIHFNRQNGTFTQFDNFSQSVAFRNNKSVLSILLDRSKRLWIGTVDGVYLSESSAPDKLNLRRIKYSQKHSNTDLENRVYIIEQSKDGMIWIGTKNGLARIHPLTYATLFHENNPDISTSISHSTIRSFHQETDSTIWVGTEKGLNKLIFASDDSLAFTAFHSEQGNINSLSNEMIMSIWQEKNGKIWLGTYGGGLNYFNKDSSNFYRITEKDGLANNVIYGVIGDKEGHLWLSTNKGISMFDPRSREIKNYKEQDGLQSDEFNIGAYGITSKGELLFGGINGLNIFNPNEVKINPYPPEIVITDLKIFNKKVKIGASSILQKHISYTGGITLNHRENNFSIEFAALHYSYPENNEYQYKMVGFEEEWIQAGKNRSAHYTNLDPGEYTFIVKGSNSDGVWSNTAASIKIIVLPPFWKTWWFRALVLFAIIGFVIGFFRYRVNIIHRQKLLLEELVKERTREVTQQKEKIQEQNTALEMEKSKAESLLLNMLPQETVEELQLKGKASARNYRMSTVMFTDFKNFTQISERMRPRELLAELDRHFVVFDEIIAKNGIEKIKTIGDSYMCAGGIPIRNKSNPIDVVLAGLEIQRYMRHERADKESKGESFWELRVGIHTGELIAGVVGIKRFAYDIWGDTVNVANRMELSGEVGKVNVSGKTYSCIKSFFDCTYRGKVMAKNKGEIDMYFVNRIKPEFSSDPDGYVPNDVFWDYVNLELFSSINYQKAEKHVLQLLEQELPKDLYYHGIHHTKDVCHAVERIAKAEGIKGEDLFLLKTAALYHDAGFTKKYMSNEDVGAELAREILPKYGYSEEQINTVNRLIMATRVPHNPADLLEQIICDADLDYLGRGDFAEISDTLRREFLANSIVRNDKEWDQLQVKFLTHHKYFTGYAIRMRQSEKMKRLEEIKARLEEDHYETT